MKRELTFKAEVIKWLPYILLKFLIQERCLDKFIAALERDELTRTKVSYISRLKYVYNSTHSNVKRIDLKCNMYRACFSEAFVFNNYWYRRYWAFEPFLDNYEEAHSK